MDSEEKKVGFWEFCDNHPVGAVILAGCVCDLAGKIITAIFGRDND